MIIESMNTPALAHSGLTRLEVVPLIHQRKARMYALADGYIALLHETIERMAAAEHATEE